MADPRRPAAPAIRTRKLTKLYGRKRGILDVDLEVRRGEIFGFLGPNAAGKTTTIRLLLDLIRPTSGEAEVLGLDVNRHSMQVRGQTGYLQGEVNLYERMTGTAFLRFVAGAGRRGTPLQAELLERLELDPAGRISRYSRGMKQKLALVAAMQHDPPLLVLDEPTSGLDPLIQQEFYRILRELQGRGRTIFFSSHVLGEVERLCDRVAIIREGRIVAVEEVQALRAKMVRPMRVTFAEPVERAWLEIDGAKVTRHEGEHVQLAVTGSVDPLLKRLAQFHVVDLEFERPSLEETFLHFYAEPDEGVGDG